MSDYEEKFEVIESKEVAKILGLLERYIENGKTDTLWSDVATALGEEMPHCQHFTGDDLMEFFDRSGAALGWDAEEQGWNEDNQLQNCLDEERMGRLDEDGNDWWDLGYDCIRVEPQYEENYESSDDDEEFFDKSTGLVFPVSMVEEALEEMEFVGQEGTSDDDNDDKGAGMAAPPVAAATAAEKASNKSEDEQCNSKDKKEAAVFLTAVMEYVAAEILELSGNSARDNRREDIQPMDIDNAISGDEDLVKLFPKFAATPLIPACLSVPDEPLKIELYWRALQRYPGNSRLNTVRYRIQLESDPTKCQVELTEYSLPTNGPPFIYCMGHGTLAKERQLHIAKTLQPTTIKALLVAAISTSKDVCKQGRSHWHKMDLVTKESDDYDVEWTHTEILVYHLGNSKFPCLYFRQGAIVGEQVPYRGRPPPRRSSTATSEQAALIDLITTATGMGTPQQFRENNCVAARDKDCIAYRQLPENVPHELQPRYFHF